MRGRISDGSWHEPFSPLASKHREDDYTEGNACNIYMVSAARCGGLMSLLVVKKDSLQN